MSDPMPDTRIQEDAAICTRNPSTNGMPPEPLPGRRITLFAGTLFGSFAGVPIAAMGASICAWLADYDDHVWYVALLAMPFGMLVGGIVGLIERARNSDIVEPSIATWVGILIGLIPSLACFFAALWSFQGLFSMLVAVGFGFIGPGIGLLFGASFDRAHFEFRSGSWLKACVRATVTLVVCAGCVPLLEWIATPNAETLERDAKAAFLDRLKLEEPDPRKRRIRKVTLTYIGNRVFVGEIHTGPMQDIQVWDVSVRHNGARVQMEAVPRAK